MNTPPNIERETPNVFDVANQVFEIMARDVKGRRDLAELNLTQAARVIDTYVEQAVKEAKREEIHAIPNTGLKEPGDFECQSLSHVFNACVQCHKQKRLYLLALPPQNQEGDK